MRTVTTIGVLVLAILAGGAARAADAPTTASANPLAERLFQDGRALADAGDHEGACAKFEASRKLDPRAVGTVLNIAMCKEATGKLATAWGYYREVAMRSRGSRPDRVELAEQKERELRPRLSSLLLEVPRARPPGLVVAIDGIALDEAAWSSALPVDGGEHVVEASAPDHVTHRATVRIASEKQTLKVAIPSLARAAAPPPPPPPRATTEPATPRGSGTRALGVALTGIGVVTLGVGAVLGVDVLSRADAPREACPSPCVRGSAAAEESQERYDALGRQALVTNILLPAGAVVTLAGVYLWLVAGARPGAKEPHAARLAPYVLPTAAGLRGTF